jgi:hypothetical protein
MPGGPGPGGQETEVTAVVSLITGILGIPGSFCCSFLAIPLWLVAIASGAYALSKINKEPARYKGKEMAIGGIVLGALAVVLFGVALAFGLGSILLDKAMR